MSPKPANDDKPNEGYDITDLARRLRHEATSKEVGMLEQGYHASDRYQLLMEASTEIKRLNKQESELATTLRQQDFEIKRLRAALDRAADALEFYDNKAEAQKARAALKDTKP